MKRKMGKKQLQAIVSYYEDSMAAMMHYRKYAELGLLLLSNVKPDDIVYIIICCHCSGGSKQIHPAVVKSVEFLGGNDARINAVDIIACRDCWGQLHVLKNSEHGIRFFTDLESAERAMKKGEHDGKNNKIFCDS